jgi:hypothetical protein
MSQDPYANKLLDSDMPCKEKSDMVGVINCVLHARAEARGLELAPFPSRALLRGEIHELIVTAEEARPEARVNGIAYVGFFEVTEGGILWAGDEVRVAGQLLGRLAGYDLTHFPNHFNIVVRAAAPLQTGFEMDIHPGAEVRFTFTGKSI